MFTIDEKAAQPKKNSRQRDKNELATNFEAPDGGWGWVICLACGLSTLFMQAPLQQYGLLYRKRLLELGFDAKQIVSVVNAQMAAAKLTGLIHGPLYRCLTYRKASIIGSILIFIGIASTALCTNFLQYVSFFSIVYGFGMGINLSAVNLAVSTYFKKHRRRAMGFAATLTGLGPIIMPHLVAYILKEFGQQGAILIMAAITCNCFICGCTLQPVLWHIRKKENTKNISNEDKAIKKLLKSNENEKQINPENTTNEKDESPVSKDHANIVGVNNIAGNSEHTLKSRIIRFFDLDLLRDLKFLNLWQGLSVMMFGEFNFSVLTPFILGNFDYSNGQISLIMSLLAGVDIVVRFIAPLLLEKVKLSNRFLFALGIIVISIGRFLVTLNNSYLAMLAIFLLIGFGKAFRTVFASLVLPSYVPLNRLAAAVGLQSFFDALFSFLCGPLLGLIVDASDYSAAIHVINIAAAFSLLLWFAEWLIRHKLIQNPLLSHTEIN